MSENQKYVAGAIAYGMVGLGCAYLSWLAGLAIAGLFVVDPVAQPPILALSWQYYNFIIGMGDGAALTYAAILTVVSTGLTYLAAAHTSKRALITMSAICLLGIAAASVLKFHFSDLSRDAPAAIMAAFFAGDDFKAASETWLNAMIAWFGATLLGELGISAIKDNGAVKELLGK